MLARRDTQREAARLRHLSPLQTLEAQSQTWGIHCHSCTLREGLSPSWPLSYKTYVVAVYPRIQVLFQPTDRTNPSMVFTCTSHKPSPSSSRANSPLPWLTCYARTPRSAYGHKYCIHLCT